MASGLPPVEPPLPLSKYSKRAILKTILSRPDGGLNLIGQRVAVGGWVKSSREFRKEPLAAPNMEGDQLHHKDISCIEVIQTKLPFFRAIVRMFGGEQRIREKLDAIIPRPPQPSISILSISDGSCSSTLQVLVDSALAHPGRVMPTGTCVFVEGVLQKPSLQGKAPIELKADKVLHIGVVDQDTYPLSKKRLPLESLRDASQFRPRTTTVASVMRIRNAITQATNAFFKEHDFLHVQVPVITATDCDGLDENFLVTTERRSADRTGGIDIDAIRSSIEEKNKQVEELKRSDSNKEALAAAIQDLRKTAELLWQLETEQKGKPGNTSRVSSSDEFFSRKTYLTASGRLHLESYASALGNVYTFGPRFRANRAESKKMLAEMWTVETEMAFSELKDSMECAEDFLKFLCKWILENCHEDLLFITKRIDKHVVERLQLIATSAFHRISYSEAVELLTNATDRKFEARVQWGIALSEEHESYLADEVYKKPIIIYNHPITLVPFYARLNGDAETAAAFDVILPKMGTLIRGSQNEERYKELSARIKELRLDNEQYEWYLDLRKHGAVNCSGFSFFLDPLVLYATGLNDARDAVPFPRSFGKANN